MQHSVSGDQVGYNSLHVMRGLVPRIHAFPYRTKKPWMPAIHAGMMAEREAPLSLRLILRSIAISAFTRVLDALWRGVSKDAAAPVPQRTMVRDARLRFQLRRGSSP